MDLQPCPFCGKEAKYHDGAIKDACLCPNQKCLLFARILDVKLWNTRPIEDSLRRRLAEAEEEKFDAVQVAADKALEIDKLQAERDRLAKELDEAKGRYDRLGTFAIDISLLVKKLKEGEQALGRESE